MYEQMDALDPVRTDDGDFLTITVRSEVCGTELRLHQANPRTLPQFQWWDQRQGRWRDPEADARMEERTDTAIAMLHRVLPDDAGPVLRERIAERWRAEGPPGGCDRPSGGISSRERATRAVPAGNPAR